jgi:hypothetical protein
MDGQISLTEHVRQHLVALDQITDGSYEEFEGCLQKAISIYNKLPHQFLHRFSVTLEPSALGSDFRQRFLALLDDQVAFLEAITLTTGFKLAELAMGISDGLNAQRFRIAVMCARWHCFLHRSSFEMRCKWLSGEYISV